MRKYGCFDRKPFEKEMIVPDGHAQLNYQTQTARVRSVPFRMAQTCQFSLTELGKVDPLCLDCVHKEQA